jgi:hypothetical protein
MAIKRYTADADTTITNAYKPNLKTRAEDANMGESDILETFSIYAQESSSSYEKSRILTKFPISEIISDRAAGSIPASGSVNFFIRLTNAKHTETTPEDFTLNVLAVSRSWDEGYGLDMESYKDLGTANWLSSSCLSGTPTAWTAPGGDYHASPVYDSFFDYGTENLEVDITQLVEEWIDGTKSNYGVGVHFTSSEESAARSFYTKRFFARGSEFFFKRPYIEARYDSTIKDRRNSFIVSSSLLEAEDNENTLFIYNRVRGHLKNIASIGTGSVYVSLYSGSFLPVGNPLTLSNGVQAVTGGFYDTGIYSASVGVFVEFPYVYDVWHNNLTGTARVEYTTGSRINVLSYDTSNQVDTARYVSAITNLQRSYRKDENVRFRTFTRFKDWNPTIYTVSTTNIESEIIEDAYYKIYRIVDGFEVVGYGTGSLNYTRLSYDLEGNYFDFDMSILEPGYAYAIKLAYFRSGKYEEQPEIFKFKTR